MPARLPNLLRLAALPLALLAALSAAETDPLPLTLAEALRLAHTQGRSITTQREDLELERLALAKVRGDYGPIPSASYRQGWNATGTGERPGETRTGEVAVTQKLPGGGTVAVTGTAGSTRTPGGGADTGTGSAQVRIDQPLLRNAGLLPWRENRISAERSLVYAQRRLADFLEDLTITTATSFWGLQRQQAAVAAARAAQERAQFTYDQSRALMSIGKNTANDVFRSETSLLQARQALIDEEAAFASRNDLLKLELAVDPLRPLAIDATPPVPERLRIDAALALAAAFANRRDLATAHDAVEDADRALALARRDLLPRLDASGQWTWSGGLGDARPGWDESPAWQVALDLEIPLDRRAEGLALERARVARLRAQRNESELRERTVQRVHDAIRRLRAAETSLAIQGRNAEQAQRRAAKAALDFKAGTLSNRDLIEAQSEVRTAEDARYTALVDYRIAELALRRDTGTLAIREDGSWDPAPPPYAARITP